MAKPHGIAFFFFLRHGFLHRRVQMGVPFHATSVVSRHEPNIALHFIFADKMKGGWGRRGRGVTKGGRVTRCKLPLTGLLFHFLMWLLLLIFPTFCHSTEPLPWTHKVQ